MPTVVKRKRNQENSSERDIFLSWEDAELFFQEENKEVDPYKCIYCQEYSKLIDNVNGCSVCEKCGRTQEQGEYTENLPLDFEENYTFTDKSYKLDSHHQEVVAQRKGGGGTVPIEVFETVRDEYVDRNWSFSGATYQKTKKILQELRKLDKTWASYYEQVPQITSWISRKNPIWLNFEQQEKIDRMFQEAKTAWVNAPDFVRKSPNGRIRKSFPNFLDFQKRCCIYQGYNEVADTIEIMKTDSTIEDLNRIWTYFGCYCHWKNFDRALLSKSEENKPQVDLELLKKLNPPHHILSKCLLTQYLESLGHQNMEKYAGEMEEK